MHTILAIDDEPGVRQSYRLILSDLFQVLLAENGAEGLETLKHKHADLILLDLTMPEMGGEAFLRRMNESGDATPVVVVTASNTVTSAVEAMKLGARDYILKPFDVDGLRMCVQRILEEEREKRELFALREAELNGFDSMIGASPAFRDVLTKAQQAMQVDSAVLITGESGTGKDLMARAIHMGGKRKERAFVALSCCAIPAPLFESELFGHERGAFTGADQKRVGKLQVADEGTLFLDELGEMPLEAQAKLLRVLQDSRFYPVGSTREVEVDIRVICATNRDLPQRIAEGAFREDLYYRINVIPLEMPSLRRRREDIPGLIAHFVAVHGPRVNARTRNITPKAMAELTTYDWPGNIRELGNTVERMLVLYGREDTINEEHVASLLPSRELRKNKSPELDEALEQFQGLPIEEATARMERYLIETAMERANHVQSRAAELLGTTRRKLKYKMDQLGIANE